MARKSRGPVNFTSEEVVTQKTRRGRPAAPTRNFPAALQKVVVHELEQIRAELTETRRHRQEPTEGFLGRSYSPEEKLQLRLRALAQDFRIRHQLLEDAVPTAQVCEMLRVSTQTPIDRKDAGTLLAIKDNGVWKFPSWQFDPEGPDGVVEGFPEVVRALRMGPLGKIRWFTTPTELFGRAPIEELRHGDKARVLYEAERSNAE